MMQFTVNNKKLENHLNYKNNIKYLKLLNK